MLVMMMMMMIMFKNSDPTKQGTQPVSENQLVNPFSEIVALCSDWSKQKHDVWKVPDNLIKK
jgi:hypothetical protein